MRIQYAIRRSSTSTQNFARSWRAPVLLALASITLLAIALRFYNLSHKSFWGDEIWAAQRSSEGFRAIVHLYLDIPGPVFYFLGRMALLVFGREHAEWAMRLPSALASVLVVPLCFAFVRRLHNTATALVAALLVACAPYQVWYAQEARFYAVSTLISLAAWSAMLRIVQGRSTTRTWFVWIALSALNMYTQPLCAGILLAGTSVAYALYTLKQQRPWAQGRRLVWAALGIAVLYSPVLFKTALAIYHKQIIGNYIDYANGQKMFPLALRGMRTRFVQYGQNALHSFSAEGGVWIIFLLLFVIGVVWLCKHRRWSELLVLGAPFGVAAVVFVAFTPVNGFNVRYILFLQPVYLALVALGCVTGVAASVRWLAQQHSQRAATSTLPWLVACGAQACLALALAATCLVSVQHSYGQAKVNDWRAIAAYISANAQSGDVVVGSAWFQQALEWYADLSQTTILVSDTYPAALDYAVQGQRVWYVALPYVEGAYGVLIKEYLAPVPDTVWMSADEQYQHVTGYFPISEVPAQLWFGGPANVSRQQFYDQPETNSVDHSYVPIDPADTSDPALSAAPF